MKIEIDTDELKLKQLEKEGRKSLIRNENYFLLDGQWYCMLPLTEEQVKRMEKQAEGNKSLLPTEKQLKVIKKCKEETKQFERKHNTK